MSLPLRLGKIPGYRALYEDRVNPVVSGAHGGALPAIGAVRWINDTFAVTTYFDPDVPSTTNWSVIGFNPVNAEMYFRVALEPETQWWYANYWSDVNIINVGGTHAVIICAKDFSSAGISGGKSIFVVDKTGILRRSPVLWSVTGELGNGGEQGGIYPNTTVENNKLYFAPYGAGSQYSTAYSGFIIDLTTWEIETVPIVARSTDEPNHSFVSWAGVGGLNQFVGQGYDGHLYAADGTDLGSVAPEFSFDNDTANIGLMFIIEGGYVVVGFVGRVSGNEYRWQLRVIDVTTRTLRIVGAPYYRYPKVDAGAFSGGSFLVDVKHHVLYEYGMWNRTPVGFQDYPDSDYLWAVVGTNGRFNATHASGGLFHSPIGRAFLNANGKGYNTYSASLVDYPVADWRNGKILMILQGASEGGTPGSGITTEYTLGYAVFTPSSSLVNQPDRSPVHFW